METTEEKFQRDVRDKAFKKNRENQEVKEKILQETQTLFEKIQHLIISCEDEVGRRLSPLREKVNRIRQNTLRWSETKVVEGRSSYELTQLREEYMDIKSRFEEIRYIQRVLEKPGICYFYSSFWERVDRHMYGEVKTNFFCQSPTFVMPLPVFLSTVIDMLEFLTKCDASVLGVLMDSRSTTKLVILKIITEEIKKSLQSRKELEQTVIDTNNYKSREKLVEASNELTMLQHSFLTVLLTFEDLSFLSDVSHWKGYDMLLDCFPELCKSGVTISGLQSRRKELEQAGIDTNNYKLREKLVEAILTARWKLLDVIVSKISQLEETKLGQQLESSLLCYRKPSMMWRMRNPRQPLCDEHRTHDPFLPKFLDTLIECLTILKRKFDELEHGGRGEVLFLVSLAYLVLEQMLEKVKIENVEQGFLTEIICDGVKYIEKLIGDFVRYEASCKERMKSIIRTTIVSTPKSVEEIKRSITSQNIQNKGTEEALMLVSSAFMKEGLELVVDQISDKSDLCNLHGLAQVDWKKIDIRFKYNPLTGGSPEEVFHSPEEQQKFKEKMEKIIALSLGIPIESLVMKNLQRGSIKFEIFFGNVNLLKIQKDMGLVENAEAVMTLKNEVCGILERHYGSDQKPLEIELKPFSMPMKFKMCANDFNPQFNFNFPNETGDKQVRGGYPYWQPNNKWRRLALNVSFYEDQEWLTMNGNPKEWAVGFHGTGGIGGKGALESIACTRFFAVGSAHACSNQVSKAPLTVGKIYGGGAEKAIYFTKSIENCYILKTEGHSIAFQCRINPAHLYDSNPDNPGEYCVVRGPENIRPYGLCIRKD